MIKPPNWCKEATPTVRGWEYKGELVKAGKIDANQIAEYNSSRGLGLLQEAPTNKSMDDMNAADYNQLTTHHSLNEVEDDAPIQSPWEKMKGSFLKS